MRVLSLFDGISCARVALDRAGIPVTAYYACEIDPAAIKVSTKNYPDIVHLGDVRTADLPEEIDLLIGGSPCQDLSIAKKDRKGLEGDRSSLFWEYVRILKERKPKWFVLENVASMPKKDKDIITAEMGVEPVLFDAALVSAQSRRRLFWTNIPFTLPSDRGIMLKDILQPDAEVDESMKIQKAFVPTPDKEAKASASGVGLSKLGHVGDKEHQASRVYDPEGKAPTQLRGPGGGALPTLVWIPPPYPLHVPAGDSTAQVRVGQEQRRKLKNGKRADDDPSVEAMRRIETRNDDKCGTLTTVLKDNHIVDVPNVRIRKLTPIECERLQGLPDNYTEAVAKTHRYKCVGNAFNVDVVAHILKQVS